MSTNETQKVSILVTKLIHAQDLSIPLPFYATSGSAGMDLMAAIDESIILEPCMRKLIPTGIAMALPHGYEAQVRPRSGLALKYGITVLNSPGTIDSDYRGEISVLLINHGEFPFVINRGCRIAQMIISMYTNINWNIVDKLPDSVRGSNGLGSTGH